MNQTDLELLEHYLDQSLDESAAVKLRSRLETDATLREGLEELKAQREARQAYFSAMEPGAGALEQFFLRVNEAIHAAELPVERPAKRLMPAWLGWAKYAVAAAACVGLGILIRPMVDSGGPGPVKVAVDQKTHRSVDVRPVSMYEVTLRDSAGTVIGVQRFESLDKAQEFAGDLSRWQSGSERLAAGKFVVTADRF